MDHGDILIRCNSPFRLPWNLISFTDALDGMQGSRLILDLREVAIGQNPDVSWKQTIELETQIHFEQRSEVQGYGRRPQNDDQYFTRAIPSTGAFGASTGVSPEDPSVPEVSFQADNREDLEMYAGSHLTPTAYDGSPRKGSLLS